jgi:endonuclease YncB( thermonuclease family)
MTTPFEHRPLARRRFLALAGSLPMGLSACGESELNQLAAGPSAKVAGVRSGDSVTLDGGQVVRLAGIEAPYGQAIYAAEASLALSDLVAGQGVELLFGGARQDPYGRTLAHLRLQRTGQWVQKALLEQGAARVRTYADNRALARPMLDAEARARKAKRGLWTLLAYRVRLPEESAVNPFGFQVVEGRVSAVDDHGYGPTIDLEHWLRADIAPSAQTQFAAVGLTPQTLKGKLIRVRGEVRPGAGGALMALDHPEQVERLRQT